MFSITGKVENIFVQPGGKGKDGKPYPDQTKIQLSGTVTLKNSERRLEMVTLTLPDSSILQLREKIGKTVTLPCGIFAKNGQIQPFLISA